MDSYQEAICPWPEDLTVRMEQSGDLNGHERLGME